MDTEDKDKTLETLFKDDANPGVPPEVEHRLRQRLTALRERMESSPSTKPRWQPFQVFSGWSRAAYYAIPAVGLLVVGMVLYATLAGESSTRAFAAVVERIRAARTMTYNITSHAEGVMSMTMQMAFKEPGLLRFSGPIGGYSVADMTQKKGITVLTFLKQYIELDLAKSPEGQAQINLAEEMRSLPQRADEELGEREMDGRTVWGFRVTEQGMDKTLWVDAKTGELIRMEGEFVNAPGLHGVLTDFRFDVELDDSLFSLDPPAGFTRLEVDLDSSAPGEQDLVETLKYWTAHHTDSLFPTKLDPGSMSREMLELATTGKFRSDVTKGMTRDELMKHTMEMTMKLTRGHMFVVQLKPDSDWHYAGDGAKLGDAATPVFWYKPTGSQTYRVVYGDLSVNDVAPQDVPSAPPDDKNAGFTPSKMAFDLSLPGEQDLIDLLKFWTTHHVDGLFPASIDPAEAANEMPDLEKSGKLRKDDTKGMTPDERKQRAMQVSSKVTRGYRFVMQLTPDNDWHYVGDGVKLGDATTPVFWYKPDGSATYRVIYGDLSVEDVAAEDLSPPQGDDKNK